jgi:curved DNA-binding protein CbpA
MSTKPPDLYAILGVPPNATQADISRAYRALVRRHHPDTRPQDGQSQDVASDATLQQVLAAYEALHDPDRRRDYDRNTGRQAPPTRQRTPQRPNLYGAHGQQPIIVGPVRWHRSH